MGEANGYGYNITETVSSNIDDKAMHELYLWPFADAVRAGVGSVMCSYQQINNSYGCQNSKTLNGLLKGELGFQGFVMSDWQAQHSGVSRYEIPPEERILLALHHSADLLLTTDRNNKAPWPDSTCQCPETQSSIQGFPSGAPT